MEQIGEVAYWLQLPAWAPIHNVFHVVFLKKYEGAPPLTVPLLPPIVRSRAVPQPEQVVQARPTADSWELLVKWQRRAPSEASWVPLSQFKEDHQEFQLEDELFRQEGGSVVDSFGQKYSRRKKKAPMATGSPLVASQSPLAD
jgi:hypothetical protein